MAVVGAGTILSYAAVDEYFPKELAGRANAALNVFHVGGAFLVQNVTGLVMQHWSMQNGHYPVIAYQAANQHKVKRFSIFPAFFANLLIP